MISIVRYLTEETYTGKEDDKRMTNEINSNPVYKARKKAFDDEGWSGIPKTTSKTIKKVVPPPVVAPGAAPEKHDPGQFVNPLRKFIKKSIEERH